MQFRPARVSSLIREELSTLFVKELEFEGALVTITEVKVDKKLEYAEVRVSVLPIEKEEETLKILKGARSTLQHLLLKKINIKPMPHIGFKIDRGPENAARVEKRLLEDE